MTPFEEEELIGLGTGIILIGRIILSGSSRFVEGRTNSVVLVSRMRPSIGCWRVYK
jgi:hypothetical protein